MNECEPLPHGVATKPGVKELVQSVEKGGEAARGRLRSALAKTASAEAEAGRRAVAAAAAAGAYTRSPSAQLELSLCPT